MADVGKVGAIGAEPSNDVSRFADIEVRRVRTLTQRVDDHGAHAFDDRPRRVWNPIAIGEIRKGADTKAEYREVSVIERHGHDLDAAKREGTSNPEQRELWQPAAFLPRRLEDVREHPAKIGQRRGRSVTPDRLPLHLGEPANLVDAEHVIGVALRKEDS